MKVEGTRALGEKEGGVGGEEGRRERGHTQNDPAVQPVALPTA
jgi:hypothetical protein